MIIIFLLKTMINCKSLAVIESALEYKKNNCLICFFLGNHFTI
ncbi:hypothetical protein A1OE_820 [Candidatus Endolissoclinum faulkneri L2]|uniref:Uncharacterized protein n=1 Tax=Candidatus Endolissoclinum faulkneri L2 TaxID=1193729 RepID=K7YHH1_9PROT|nr:hypothetical protein A1OE_820 [Candidatus Endolissoclinum faulkneri L2]